MSCILSPGMGMITKTEIIVDKQTETTKTERDLWERDREKKERDWGREGGGHDGGAVQQ